VSKVSNRVIHSKDRDYYKGNWALRWRKMYAWAYSENNSNKLHTCECSHH